MKVAIVVACTKRKAERVGDNMFFHTLPEIGAERLIDQYHLNGQEYLPDLYAETLAYEWLGRADDRPDDEKLPVAELYAGGSWSKTKELLKESGDNDLYVLSAGFGLLAADDLIPPYSASFGAGEDQVCRKLLGWGASYELHQLWWRNINDARTVANPLTLLTGEYDVIFLAASVPYLKAVARDLEVCTKYATPDKLFIVSAGASSGDVDSFLEPYCLPIDHRLRRLVTGSLTSFNHGTMKLLLCDIVPKVGWSREALTQALNNLSLGTSDEPTQGVLDLFGETTTIRTPKKKIRGDGPVEVPESRGGGRQRLSDETVKEWITEFISMNPSVRKSNILSVFRGTGQSCSMQRFNVLIEEVLNAQETGFSRTDSEVAGATSDQGEPAAV